MANDPKDLHPQLGVWIADLRAKLEAADRLVDDLAVYVAGLEDLSESCHALDPRIQVARALRGMLERYDGNAND